MERMNGYTCLDWCLQITDTVLQDGAGGCYRVHDLAVALDPAQHL